MPFKSEETNDSNVVVGRAKTVTTAQEVVDEKSTEE